MSIFQNNKLFLNLFLHFLIILKLWTWFSSAENSEKGPLYVGTKIPRQLHMQTYLCGYVLLHIFSKILQFTSQTGKQWKYFPSFIWKLCSPRPHLHTNGGSTYNLEVKAALLSLPVSLSLSLSVSATFSVRPENDK